jgi:rhodanese-related sulfurtransferase
MQRRRIFQEEAKDSRAVVVGGMLILLVGGYMIFRQFYGEEPETVLTDASDDSKMTQEETMVPSISTEVVRQKILNGDKVRFLDLRGEESFKTEHIPHSLPMSPSSLATYTPASGELSVVVFSSKETETLEVIKNTLRQKSSQLFLLEGGFEQWKKEGNQTIGLGDPNSFIDQSKVTYITPSEVAGMLSTENPNLFILDVQSEQNYQRRHIKGAKNIPLDQLEKRSEEIPPAKNIIVYGESELISFQGGVRLSDLNIFTAKTLSGNAHLQKESPLPLEP